jgi:hypothetical protein
MDRWTISLNTDELVALRIALRYRIVDLERWVGHAQESRSGTQVTFLKHLTEANALFNDLSRVEP